MIEVRQTDQFKSWFEELKDVHAKARVQTRIDRLSLGLFGDVTYLDVIGEVRIDYGPGYRLYFVKRGNTVVVLLCGGDKSTQKKDIKHSIEISKGV